MVDKTKTVKVVVDPTGVKRGVAEIKRQFATLGNTITNQLGTLGNKTLFTLGSSISILSKKTISFTSIIKNMGRAFITAGGMAVKGLSFIGGKIKDIIKSLGGLKTLIQGVFTTAFFRSIIKGTITLQKFASTLTVVTGDLDSAKVKIGDLVKIVQRFGVSFEAALGPFAKFFAAAKGTLTDNEILRIFESFTKVSAALQLNVQEVQGVFLALQQIASKGRVSMEELRLQLAERVPGAMQIAARAMGTSIRELEDNIRKGTIASGEFLSKFGRALDEDFAKAAETASQLAFAALNRFKNSLLLFTAQIGEGGFIDALQRLLSTMTQWFDNNYELANRLGMLLGDMLDTLTNMINKLDDDTITNFLNGTIDLLYDLKDLAIDIGNTRFFKWIFGESTSSQIKAIQSEIETLNQDIIDLIAKSQAALAKYPNAKDTNERIAQQFNAAIASKAKRIKFLDDQINLLRGDRPSLRLPEVDQAELEANRQADLERQLETLGKTYSNVAKEVEFYNEKLTLNETKVSRLTFVNNQLKVQYDQLADANRRFRAVDLQDPQSLQNAIAAGQRISGITSAIIKLEKERNNLQKSIAAEELRRQDFSERFLRDYANTEEQVQDRLTRRIELEDKILMTQIELDRLQKSIANNTFTASQEKEAKRLLGTLKEAQTELKGINTEQRQYERFIDSFNIKTKALYAEELNWYERLTKAQGELKAIKEEIIELNQKAQVTTLSKEEQDRVKTLFQDLKATEGQLDEMSVFAKRAAENIQDIFADFLFDPFEDGVKGMLQQFGEMLRRMIAEAAAAQIGEAIFGKNGANLTSLFTTVGGFFTGAASAGAGSTSSGFTGAGVHSSFAPRAHGGPVMAGVPVIVGDRVGADKREIFVPNQSGKILTKSEEQDMLRGSEQGPIIVNVTVAQDVTRASGVQVGNDIAEQISRAQRLS